MYQNYCKKCGSFDLFIESKGNNTGLYCASCGTWQQWMNKNDIRAFEHNKATKKPNCKMRHATPEEQASINKYLKNISKPTGVNVLDDKTMHDRLKEFVEFLNRKIDSEYEKLPILNEDAIRKNAYCFALQQDIWALQNILGGKDWNYKE